MQQRIKELPEGELMVGRAMILETGDELIPYLISAPRMRVPMNFNIATSVNPYLAMKATLIEARKHPKIEHIAISGFCTGVGRMLSEDSYSQALRKAKLGLIVDEMMEPMDWGGFALVGG